MRAAMSFSDEHKLYLKQQTAQSSVTVLCWCVQVLHERNKVRTENHSRNIPTETCWQHHHQNNVWNIQTTAVSELHVSLCSVWNVIMWYHCDITTVLLWLHIMFVWRLTAGKCPDVSSNVSVGFTVTDVKTQSWTVVSGLNTSHLL